MSNVVTPETQQLAKELLPQLEKLKNDFEKMSKMGPFYVIGLHMKERYMDIAIFVNREDAKNYEMELTRSIKHIKNAFVRVEIVKKFEFLGHSTVITLMLTKNKTVKEAVDAFIVHCVKPANLS